MKTWKKILTLSLSVLLLFGMSVNSVQAAGDVSENTGVKQSYTYTVTFYAGNQGVFEGTEGLSVTNPNVTVTQTDKAIVVSGLELGDKVGLTAQSAVSLSENGKYYVQGIRLSARDNDTVAVSAFIVEEDADYVVAYGIKGNQVSYTVKYQDENGNQMAPDETFYGNVGDKPVIAYKYIGGYAPKHIGVTKTLSANAAENIFTFVYEPVPTNTIETIVTENVVEKVETIIVPGTGTGAGGNAEAVGGEDTDTEEDDDTTGGGNSETDDTTETDDTSETDDTTETDETSETDETEADGGEDDENILDLDDEEVPLAPGVDKDATAKALRFAGYIGLVVASVSVLVGIAVIAAKRKKNYVQKSNGDDSAE